MSSSFLIMLREGLEAGLIVAIVLAYLRQLDRRDAFGAVGLGAGAAALISLVTGVALYLAIGGLSGDTELLAFAATSLIACAVLTWMIFWMRQQSRNLGGKLRGDVDRALATGTLTALASVVFFGVLREGLETVLFLLAVVVDRSALDLVVGAGAGLVGAAALSYAFYRGGRRVNLRLFFQITGSLIILVAAGLASRGVGWLQEAGVINTFHWPLWDLSGNAVLGRGPFAEFLNGLFGWNPQPSLEEAATWIAFVAVGAQLFFFGVPSFAWIARLARGPETSPAAPRVPAAALGAAAVLAVAAAALITLTSATAARPGGTVGLGEKREEQVKGTLATVDITLGSMFIQLNPATVSASEIEFSARNVGGDAHEAIFIATDLPEGALPVDQASNQVITSAPGLHVAGEIESFTSGQAARFESAADATSTSESGEAEQGIAELPPGRYVVICNIPGHYAAGMHSVLTVR